MQPRLLRSPARLAGVSLLRAQSDERLVALARDGHERAFAVIVERYRAQLERYATRLVGPERGEDALQQAFINAHTDLLRHPDRTVELRPWLYRIVHNTSLNTLRSSHDEVSLGEAAERIPLSDDAVERRERLREALAAVAALPPQQRDAILLRELEGRSHEEIAQALHVSTGAARQQIFRARAALRAAVTAVTPQPLLIRLLEMASAPAASPSAELATAGASAGLAAVLAKAGATLVVGGAVVGGAVGTGAVHLPSHDDGASGSSSAIVERDRPSAVSPMPIAALATGAGATVEGVQARGGPGSSGEDERDDDGSSGSGRGDDSAGRGGSDSSGPGPAATTGGGDDDRSGPSEHSGKGETGGDDTPDDDGTSGKGVSGGGDDTPDDDVTAGDASGKGVSGGGTPGDTTDDGGASGGSSGDTGDSGDSGGGGDSSGPPVAEALMPQAPVDDAISNSGSDARNESSSGGSSGGGSSDAAD